MISNLKSKYLSKKAKNLNDYAKSLESIITLENNTLWKTKQEFLEYAKEVIDLYVNNYYFDNNMHRDNPIEYVNDNINVVLKALVSYCKKNNQTLMLKEKKNETFLLSVIVTVATYLDIATNIVDGNFLDTKNKFKYLLKYLENTKILKIYLNNIPTINNLFDLIKKNNSNEEKFFKCFENELYYNSYEKYTDDDKYYLVKFNYQVNDLDEYDTKLVKEIEDKYQDKYFKISYELLEIYYLKELISNREIPTFLIPVNKDNIKLIGDSYLKENVSLLIKVDDKYELNEEINNLKSMGYKINYLCLEHGEVNDNYFGRDMDVFINSEFKKLNEEKIYSWNNRKVNFIVNDREA